MSRRTVWDLRELANDETVDPDFRERMRQIADAFERRIQELEAAGITVDEGPLDNVHGV